jgi:hypothetical protein
MHHVVTPASKSNAVQRHRRANRSTNHIARSKAEAGQICRGRGKEVRRSDNPAIDFRGDCVHTSAFLEEPLPRLRWDAFVERRLSAPTIERVLAVPERTPSGVVVSADESNERSRKHCGASEC